MTSTLPPRTSRARPPRPTRTPAPAAAPGVLVPGLTAAAWAAVAGLLVVAVPLLLAWATDSRSTTAAATAMRTAGQVWLLGQGVRLHVPTGSVGLTPLGLLAVQLLLLHRAGRHAARTTQVPAAAQLVAGVTVPYAVVVVAVALLSRDGGTVPSLVWAGLCGLLVGLVGAGSGIVRETGWWLWSRVPEQARDLAAAGAAALAALLAAGGIVGGCALLVHLSRAGSLGRAASPGLVGGLALLLLGLSLVPNAVVWGTAWVTGPGFAFGVGTHATPLGTTLGRVPDLPLLAALPAGDPPRLLGVVALLLPLVAGVVGALVLLGRRELPGWLPAVQDGLLVGVAAAVPVGLLALLSGGPLGGHRLAEVGPSAWQVALTAGLEVGLAAALTCVASGLLRARSGGVPSRA